MPQQVAPGSLEGVRTIVAFSLMASVLVTSLRAQTVRGTILDASTEEPVSGAAVSLRNQSGDSIAQAESDSAGRFVFEVREGDYSFRIIRIGYQRTLTPAVEALAGDVIRVVIRIVPLGTEPAGELFSLSPIVVEGQAVDRHMEAFERNRQVGLGDHVVREEFEEWHPQQVTDVIRRMSGFTVIPNSNYGRPHPRGGVDTRPYMIEVPSRIHRTALPTECPPLMFLDGASIGNTETTDITLLPIDLIEAVEAYSRQNQMPAEYSKRGSECGVIAFWTRRADATQTASSLELGVNAGGYLAAAEPEGTHIGIHFITPFAGPFEFYAALHRILSLREDAGGVGQTGWQAKAATRLQFRASKVPFYVGTGVVFLESTTTVHGRAQLNPGGFQLAHATFAGLTYGLGALRPMVEIQFLDLFELSDVGVQVFVGVGFEP